MYEDLIENKLSINRSIQWKKNLSNRFLLCITQKYTSVLSEMGVL